MRKLTSVLAALALLAGGGAAPTAFTASAPSVTKSALPAPERRSRRAVQQMIDGNAAYVPGAQTGNGWVRLRTRNFRRKGVGSRWRFTMHARAA
jgi:hypothetical protein